MWTQTEINILIVFLGCIMVFLAFIAYLLAKMLEELRDIKS